MKDLSIIILNYNSHIEVIRQISDITKELDITKENFIILDNDSDDGKILQKYCLDNDFFFHQMSSNMGYAFANNWAIKKAIEFGKEYFMILNPDIHINNTSISKLYNDLLLDSSLAVIGPRTLYHNDTEIIFSDGGLLYPKKGFEGNHVNFLKKTNEVDLAGINYDIDYVNGSCMMFRKNVLEDLGFMEDKLFMYYEESEWCYRIKKSNRWKIGIDTDVVAYQSDSSRGKVYEYYMTRNRIWITKKYSGNLFYLIRERLIVARKKFFSSKGDFKENIEFSSNIIKAIFHGLIGKKNKL